MTRVINGLYFLLTIMLNIHKIQAHAIQLALQRNWKEAIKVNKEALRMNPSDTETLLRIGYAYMQLQDYVNSKKYYQKALKQQSGNSIALHQLEKIDVLLHQKKDSKNNHNTKDQLQASEFLKIPGKTIVVSLVNIGQAHTIAKLVSGEKTVLKIRKRRVEVRTLGGEYIGVLPDDISRRLIIFMTAKSKYSAFIHSVQKQNVEVFIREETKGKKVSKYISFPKDIFQDIKFLESDDMQAFEDANEDDLSHLEKDSKGEEPLDIEQLAQLLDEEKESPIHSSLIVENDSDDEFNE